MKPRTKLLCQIVAFVAAPAAVLLLPLCIGIWLPDIFDDRIHVLAEASTPSGYQFQVQQYWNHGDFYTTQLKITRPNGTVLGQVLDPDDDKSWSVPLSIDEPHRSVTVILSGNRLIQKSWDYTPPPAPAKPASDSSPKSVTESAP